MIKMKKEHECVIRIDYSTSGTAKNDLFGVFFEDLNHAADGGIYGELIQNRNFEFDSLDNEDYTPLTAWEKVGRTEKVILEIMDMEPVSQVNPHYLCMETLEENAGVWNIGYNCGIPYETGKSYIFSCYAKNKDMVTQKIKAVLCGTGNEIYGEAVLPLTDRWERFEIIITCNRTDYTGRLALLLPEPGKVAVDFVSLFPVETFKKERNGLRNDLAQAIADMKPGFLRFPGGCLVHCGSLCSEDRNSMYRWKNTLGNIENRPARSSNWHYHQTLGLGYFEYFLFCEQIGAKPLPVIPAGFDPHTQNAAPMGEMQEWIEEALDLIEFANGPAESRWGAIREKMGHPKPFGMEYLAIGNEEQGNLFFERYAVIQAAVREKYPEIKLICSSGPFAAGGDFENGWEWSRKEGADLVDEHYYQGPEWFIANQHRYDGYSAEGPKVFLGEYASKGNEWFHALAEASFMIGLERNADKVSLACYAPMLCNVDYINWDQANMIWFDNHRMILTASYYVQKLFMNHQGDRELPCVVETDLENENWSCDNNTGGEIIFSGISSQVFFSEISVTDEAENVYLCRETCELMAEEQVSLGKIDLVNYRIHFRARQLSNEGDGFSICFGKRDEKNQMILSLGGWNRANNTLDEMVNGKASTLSQYAFELQIGKEYDVNIVVKGRNITVEIDGKTFQNIEQPVILVEPLYCSASMENETDDLIVKLVNLTERTYDILIPLGENNFRTCREFVMYGYTKNEKNSFESPDKIRPEENDQVVEGSSYTYHVEKESFAVLRFSIA